MQPLKKPTQLKRWGKKNKIELIKNGIFLSVFLQRNKKAKIKRKFSVLKSFNPGVEDG